MDIASVERCCTGLPPHGIRARNLCICLRCDAERSEILSSYVNTFRLFSKVVLYAALKFDWSQFESDAKFKEINIMGAMKSLSAFESFSANGRSFIGKSVVSPDIDIWELCGWRYVRRGETQHG